MAEEIVIDEPQIEHCNVFSNKSVILKEDGTLHLVDGVPSDSGREISVSRDFQADFSFEKKKKGAESNRIATHSVDVHQRPDLLALYNEQLVNSQRMYLEQQKAINELTKSVADIKNAVLTKKCETVTQPQCVPATKQAGTSQKSYYDSVSEDESERDFESSDDSGDEARDEPPEKRPKNSVTTSKIEKMKIVEKLLTKQQQFGLAVHQEIAKIVNQGSEATMDHKSKEVQELLDKYVRPENCEFLEVPKVNKVLWTSKDTAKHLKDTDRALQRTQTYLVKGMVPVVQLMDKSLNSTSEESEVVFEKSLDSLNLLLYAHRDLSNQRRKQLTPALNRKYVELGHEGEKISPNFLFGEQEHLEKRMKEIDDGVKLGKKMKGKIIKERIHDKESNREDIDGNFGGGFIRKSGFKSNFLAKRAQIRREGRKKIPVKKSKGGLGHQQK